MYHEDVFSYLSGRVSYLEAIQSPVMPIAFRQSWLLAKRGQHIKSLVNRMEYPAAAVVVQGQPKYCDETVIFLP